VVQHVLLARLKDLAGVPDHAGVGDDNVQPTRNTLNLFDRGAVVGFVGGDELDDVKLAVMFLRESVEGGRRSRIASAGKDNDVLACDEVLNEAQA
jgi:hypothetical protein